MVGLSGNETKCALSQPEKQPCPVYFFAINGCTVLSFFGFLVECWENIYKKEKRKPKIIPQIQNWLNWFEVRIPNRVKVQAWGPGLSG